MTKENKIVKAKKEEFLKSCGIKGKYGETMLNDLLNLALSQREEEVREIVKEMKKTKTYPQSLNKFDGSVEYLERLSDGDIHYNQAIDEILQALNKTL